MKKWLAILLSTVLLATAIPGCSCSTSDESTPSSDEVWSAWAKEVETEVFDELREQGVLSNQVLGDTTSTILNVIDGVVTFGNSEADDKYLANTGVISGKVAIFFNTEDQPRIIRYDESREYNFHDEVLDASTYSDDSRSAQMPFDAGCYAQNPEECDTLVIVQPYLASGDEAIVNDKTAFADTEVIIIDANSRNLQHIEYLGTCLTERVLDNPYGMLMRGEAMAYLASLSVDGVPSDKPYMTPYRSGDEGPSDEELAAIPLVNEIFVATGDFGGYNTMIINVVERNTPIVSQQKVESVAIRLYQIEGNAIVTYSITHDVQITSFNPYNLSFAVDGGSISVVCNVSYENVTGTIIFSGGSPQEFIAPIAPDGVKGCPDCQGSGLINGQEDPRCSGSGQVAVYGDLLI